MKCASLQQLLLLVMHMTKRPRVPLANARDHQTEIAFKTHLLDTKYQEKMKS